MQIDFYQLGRTSLEQVIASISQRLLVDGKRLLIVAEDEGLLGRLDRMLWDQSPRSFLPHASSGGSEDARQPILLSTSTDAPNIARNILIADGQWREAALTFDRAFYLFDAGTLDGARLAWKLVAGREGVDRRYWAQDERGKWMEKG
jgi:DNA polymerase III subunit chi